MQRSLFLLCLLASYSVAASDMPFKKAFLSSYQVMGLCALGGFIASAYAQNSTAPNSSTQVLTTNFFVYWSTWLGDIFGIFDFIGWTFDWIFNWMFYIKSDCDKVMKLRAEIDELKKNHHTLHKKELEVATTLCDVIIEYCGNDPDVQREKREEIIECVNHVIKVLSKESPKPDD